MTTTGDVKIFHKLFIHKIYVIRAWERERERERKREGEKNGRKKMFKKSQIMVLVPVLF